MMNIYESEAEAANTSDDEGDDEGDVDCDEESNEDRPTSSHSQQNVDLEMREIDIAKSKKVV